MKRRLALFVSTLWLAGSAMAEAPPLNLPPAEVVARVLRQLPMVQAARGQIGVEEAQRTRYEAGTHEWSVRLGGQQRRTTPAAGPDERYSEWNAALERPVRLPGKAAIDARIGTAGVDLARTGYGDALHEASRSLVKAWFDWLRDNASATQWAAQVELLDKQAAAIRRRRQLGDAAQIEVTQSAAALAQAQAQLSQARTRQHTSALDLSRRFPGLPLVEPAQIEEPARIEGSAPDWIGAILEHHHELALALGEADRTRLVASRADRERLPDPTLGILYSRERGGEEHVVGAYISIPLPGDGRRATANTALAQTGVAEQRAAAIRQRVEAEAASLFETARSSVAIWQAGRIAADHLKHSADQTARAYQLGEGTLGELLTSRRLAHEAELAARLQQLDALELRSRLLLDAHRLWDFDVD